MNHSKLLQHFREGMEPPPGSFIGQESIAFQPTTFFKELISIIEEMKKKSAKDLSSCEETLLLVGIIKHHTNLKIDVRIDGNSPCIEVPFIDKNHILINDWMREFITSNDGIKMIGNARNVVRGTVNMKTAKVTGVFAEVGAKMHLPTNMFTTNQFAPSEIAAIMLHEVGHLFTMYEFMTRTVRTNQVLAGLSKALDKSNSIEEREAIFARSYLALSLSEEGMPDLSASNDKKYVEIVIIGYVTKEAKSELGANIYDMNSWEYLCDEFAARQGAGRDLFTGLAKLYRGHREFRSTPFFLFVEAIKILSVVLLPFIPTMVLLVIMAIMADGRGNGTYDEPIARLRRIRSQIVENLKDRDLPKSDYIRLTEDLDVMDKFLSTVTERRQFFTVLADFLGPWAKNEHRFVQLQKDLELIGNNDLFVKSAQLKNLI